AQGARSFQWYRDGAVIEGATEATYTTPPVTGTQSGSQYQVRVGGPGCLLQGTNPPSPWLMSAPATLTVRDDRPPPVAVPSPAAGDIWVLSPTGGPANVQTVAWSMSDNVFVCQERVWLEYSTDAGTTWSLAPTGGLDETLGALHCHYPGVMDTTNL